MSYVALVTDQYATMADFYGGLIELPVVRAWDRPGARATVFQSGHLRIEVLDNQAKSRPLTLAQAGARLQLVIEVLTVDPIWHRLGRPGGMPPPCRSWGARLIEWRDPDENPIVFLEWLEVSV